MHDGGLNRFLAEVIVRSKSVRGHLVAGKAVLDVLK